MNNKPVLFLDSGIGGFLYCMDFIKKNPHEETCYLADRERFPYGQRTKEDLSSILITLTEKMLKLFDPKIIVLACNTATVSAIDSLRRTFPQIPFIGTVPAIKPAAAQSKKRKIGVLGTQRTIEDPYLQRSFQHLQRSLEDNLNIDKEAHSEIIGIAAPELVEFVENCFDDAGENEKNAIVKKYINLFIDEGVDCLVLGCTHFLYLLDEFKKESAPSIAVFDSLDGITRRIEYFLDEESGGALRAEENFRPSHQLILTGTHPPESSWQKRANCFNSGDSPCFKLSLLQHTR